jgi:Rod binding domain-containing protein
MPSAHGLAAALHSAGASKHAAAMSPHDKKLMKHSQRLVSQTFFGTMLKQMRNSPFKSKILDGGRGGEAFHSLLDQHLADRMASGSGKKLANAIYHHLKRFETARNKTPANPSSLDSALKASRTNKSPASDWRSHVPTDLRA